MKLNCPACGAEVIFRAKSSIFGVCSFCSSTLVRHDMNLESLGKMSELPQDMSPIQIGTSGVFERAKFAVVGRQKISWADGSWNEWYVLFDDGRDAWLGDAQGHYMVSFQVRDQFKLPALSQINVNASVALSGATFTVEDIKEVVCVGSEGELPVKGAQGRKSTSVDLSGPDKRFGNIDFATEGNRLFFGKYAEFEELQLMNLRELDGW